MAVHLAGGVRRYTPGQPVTAHLVYTGRISQWSAIALGRLTFSGARPEIGPSFFDLFVCP